jgi:hypothetical protein
MLEALQPLAPTCSALVSAVHLQIDEFSFPFLGNHQGEIFVFSIPPTGTNIFLKETMPGQ